MKTFARYRPRQPPGTMNKLEKAYSEYLFFRKKAGDILDYKFEAIKLKLAPSTFYTPDFMVFTNDGFIEMHEAKGFWEDDARVKIKVAAEMFPFRFVAITRSKDGWKEEDFGG